MGLVYIANLESGLNVRNALNSMFSELYSSLTAPIFAENVTSNTAIGDVPGNSFIESIALFNTSGSPTIKIGTTSGGNEILDTIPISGFQLIETQIYEANLFNIFITFGGTGAVNIRFNIIYNYL